VTAIASTISTECAACGLGLRDADDARTGLDRSCRAQFNYRQISSLSDEARAEVNTTIHSIAQNRLRGDELRLALFRLYELGFVELSQRIERRTTGVRSPTGRAVDQQAVESVKALEKPKQVEIEFEAPPEVVVRPLPFSPTNDQERAIEAVRRAMSRNEHSVTVIVGYAGVGKTSLILFLAHEFGLPCVIAPTGKAALRIREATGLDASTIHRLIYAPHEDPKTGATVFVRRTADEIEQYLPRSRLLILDEASMVGPDVWTDIITVAKQHGLKLVVIGDGFQLPPVMPPKSPPFSVLLPNFAAQLNAERVEMTEVLRQAQGSPIIRASMGLRQGQGKAALRELQVIQHQQIASVCLAVYQEKGVTICHTNSTRHGLNAGIRQMLGIYDEMPQPGEPLMVLRNTYDAGVVNGETITFPGWERTPDVPEAITDRYNPELHEMARFGSIRAANDVPVVLALEEMHGRLKSSVKAISIAAMRWARLNNVFTGGGNVAPHLPVNFGYAYTAHKSQGSAWPFVFVIIEPSIRVNEEEGARWLYTAITRAESMVALFWGKVW
jgi:exodeoxyribonuclease V